MYYKGCQRWQRQEKRNPTRNLPDMNKSIETIQTISTLADLDAHVATFKEFKYASEKTKRRFIRKANAKAKEIA
jgi:hypothetical protein